MFEYTFKIGLGTFHMFYLFTSLPLEVMSRIYYRLIFLKLAKLKV